MRWRRKSGASLRVSQKSQADLALEYFRAAADSGRLSHAWLVSCTDISDGLGFAERALAYLFCGGLIKPCGDCPACRQVSAHRHPDVQWVEPILKSRKISIEHMLEVNSQIARSSFAGGWKAAVLLNADRMTDEAANSFLKTLEEPPGQTVLFLLTDAVEDCLPTILSRCHRVTLQKGERPGSAGWMPDLLELLRTMPPGGYAEGAAHAAELAALIEREKKRIEDEMSSRPSDDDSRKAKEVFEARVSAAVRLERSEMLRNMVLWQRDVMFAAQGLEDETFHFRGDADVIRRQAEGLTWAKARARVEAVEAMARRFEQNLNEITVLELGVAALAR